MGRSAESPRDRRLPRRSLSHDRAQPATRSPKPLNRRRKPRGLRGRRVCAPTGPTCSSRAGTAAVAVPRAHVDVARERKARRAHPGRIEVRAESGAEYACMAWHGRRWSPRRGYPALPAVIPRWVHFKPSLAYRQCSAPSHHAGRPSGRRTLQYAAANRTSSSDGYESVLRTGALSVAPAGSTVVASHRRVPLSSSASLSSA